MSKLSGIILFVFGLALSCQPLATAQEKTQETKSYYPLKAGNKWTYQIESDTAAKGSKLINQIAKIEKIDGVSLSRLETTAKGKVVASEHLSITDKGIFRNRYNDEKINPPICILKFPTKKDSTWKTESMTGAEKLSVSCKSDEEEIEVPAGKFKTVKVVMDAEVVGAGIIVSTTYWFAQGVGIVKQHVNINSMQFTLLLEKFEEGK
ncbi:MAG: hypothetical protein NTV50_00590 [Planctomycetota bacterium]|nr:hypothetical protein [Planctomycetota bacterium]